ncbi:PAS domain S-box protein [Methanoregula formicica]|uniref:PAS domain S-box n=1 Tax=Methanoregula formicica (strain DSM 22288 / NBRC 105244 / SMSP) TaxID=593750 RepID=L0HEU0_METFS|nr:PAS domain S-box protein [Methanoregula formicica]AGB03232.1 PAS domain S-box [Methanoregula formicica SMSP]
MSEAKILIVEDEAVTGMDIRKSLVEMGYSVVAVATTGELAVRKAAELHPDLILMDIMLAGRMNGIEAADKIRRHCHIPVVYLTAYSDDSFLAKAKLTEPFGYILKPFRELELKTTIEMALYKYAMEHALRISEETTRVILDATDDFLFLIDPRGKFLAVNQALAKKAGRDVRDFIGTDIARLVTQGILSSRMAAWNLNTNQKEPVRFQEEFHNRWFDAAIYPVTSPEGDVVLFAISIRDITAQKTLEEQSRQNEEFFRSLIEDTSDVIAVLDRDGTLRHESPSITRYLGYDPECIVGKPFSVILTEESLPVFRQVLEEVLTTPGMVRAVNLPVKCEDGSPRILEGIISNLYGNPVIDGIVVNGWVKK